MFHRCDNEKQSKDLYRKLCKLLHPDHGGDNECFILLKECYDLFVEVQEQLSKDKIKAEPTKKPAGDPAKYALSDFDILADDACLEVINEIKKYATSHSKFSLSFTESVAEYLEENGFITSAQYNKLVKIYYAFRMDKEIDKKKED